MGKRRGQDGEDAASGGSRKAARVTNGASKGKGTPEAETVLQRVQPKPYFMTTALGYKDGAYKHLNGILTYDLPTGKFAWKRNSFPLHSFYDSSPLRHAPIEVEGLLYCHHPDNLSQLALFSIHTNTWHLVPSAPEISKFESALGMSVDTSQKPYSFQLFQGSVDKKTQVYDSKSGTWSTRSSLLGPLGKDTDMYASCMSSNGCLYLTRGPDVILVYSIEKDNWSLLRGPPVVEEDEEHKDNDHTLGAFEGRIFTARHDTQPEDSVVVWELVKEEWVEYARISGDPYEWLQEHEFFGHDTYDHLGIVTCFCNEYLFIYNWSFGYAQADGYVLFNLATKECTKVDLPQGTIKTELEEGDEDYRDSEEEDEDEDEDGEDEGKDSEDGEDQVEDDYKDGEEEDKEGDAGEEEDEDEE